MSTDGYVPSEDEMREAYVWLSAGDNEGARRMRAELSGAFAGDMRNPIGIRVVAEEQS